MNDPPDSTLLLIAFIILSENGNYSNKSCVFEFGAKMGEADSPGSFSDNNCISDTSTGKISHLGINTTSCTTVSSHVYMEGIVHCVLW